MAHHSKHKAVERNQGRTSRIQKVAAGLRGTARHAVTAQATGPATPMPTERGYGDTTPSRKQLARRMSDLDSKFWSGDQTAAHQLEMQTLRKIVTPESLARRKSRRSKLIIGAAAITAAAATAAGLMVTGGHAGATREPKAQSSSFFDAGSNVENALTKGSDQARAEQKGTLESRASIQKLGLRTGMGLLTIMKNVTGNRNAAPFSPSAAPTAGVDFAGESQTTSINAAFMGKVDGSDQVWVSGNTTSSADSDAHQNYNIAVRYAVSAQAATYFSETGMHRNVTASDFMAQLRQGDPHVLEIAFYPDNTPGHGKAIVELDSGEYVEASETITPNYSLVPGQPVTNPEQIDTTRRYIDSALIDMHQIEEQNRFGYIQD